MGALAFDPQTGEPSVQSGTLLRSDAWSLDQLGNWVGDSTQPGRLSAGNLDGWGTAWQLPGASAAEDVRSLSHGVNFRNQLLSIEVTETSTQREARHDAAGNLVFDGEHFYQYDAWNRLLQVNRATMQGGTQQGQDPVPPTLVVGVMVKHYAYDGLGRLVRTQSPYPNPEASDAPTRSERFYYDGIRRIQELGTNPILTIDDAEGSSDPGILALLAQTVEPGLNQDGSGTPLAFEQGQMDSGGDPSPQPLAPVLEREYVWGPGDTGIDELLVQYDAGRNPWWVVQDGGGDVVALCDLGGSGSDARVVAQWTYDAYGAALSADHLHAHAYIHCGHKALFADRLDVGVATAYGQPLPRIVPFARVLCHVRNRVYQPELGRWNQADPNATALVLLESSSYHGMGMAAVVAAFDVEARYGDGMNLYEYLGSNPWNRRDPLGLSWDPFSMVDEFLASRTASAASLLNSIGSGTRTVAMVTATIASYLPFPGIGLAGELALAALEGRPLGPTLLAASVGLVPGGKLSLMFGILATELADLETRRNANAEIDEEMLGIIQEFMGGGGGGGPAQASLTAKVIGGVISQGLPLMSIFTEGLGGSANTHVYAGKDAGGNIVYVGLSVDVVRRQTQHGGRFSRCEQITAQPVTRLQARAIELAAMTRYGSTGGTTIHAQYAGQNKIRSIGPKRALFFQAALSWGSQWLAQNARHLH